MKNIFKYLFIAIPFGILVTSCDVDRLPENAISDDTYWKSETDLQGAANYLYTFLPGFSTEDNQSDDSFGRSSNAVNDGSRLVPSTDGSYNNPYRIIRASNKILEKSAGMTGLVSDAVIKRYQGEARFFRAWAYFDLVQTYGGVPLILKTLADTDAELYQGQATRDQIMEAIYADLDFASANLPKASAIPAGDYGRVSSSAALAFLGRVSLFEGTRAKYHSDGDSKKHLQIAKTASEKVIASGEHTLYKNYFGMFQYEGEGRSNTENILVKQYGVDRSNSVVTNNFFRASIEQGQINPTKSLVDSYLMTDGLPKGQSPLYKKPTNSVAVFDNRDLRLSGTVAKRGDAWIGSRPEFDIANPSFNTTGWAFRKFINIDDWTLQKSNMDRPLIRYAEVLLINAEASYELDGSISDATLDKSINKLRPRAGIAKLTNAFVTANGLDMKQEIRRERRVELAMEGFRYWDLIRWKTAEIELPKAVLGNYFFAEEYGTAVAVNLTPDNYIIALAEKFKKFDPAKDYLSPFPLNELALNPALQQNKGWK